jgi:hypothetical protein
LQLQQKALPMWPVLVSRVLVALGRMVVAAAVALKQAKQRSRIKLAPNMPLCIE